MTPTAQGQDDPDTRPLRTTPNCEDDRHSLSRTGVRCHPLLQGAEPEQIAVSDRTTLRRFYTISAPSDREVSVTGSRIQMEWQVGRI